MLNTLPFCKSCGSKCCKSTPPALTSNDIDRIKAVTGTDVWLEEKNGAYVIAKKTNSNDCYFLDENGMCKIYSYRPLDCKLFPLFMKIIGHNNKYFKIEWRIWYCPLTNALGVEKLLHEAKSLVIKTIQRNPDELLEYQYAMKKSGGYKRKHFLVKEKIKIENRGQE